MCCCDVETRIQTRTRNLSSNLLTVVALQATDPSKESSFSHGVIWNRIRKLFDLADAQLHSTSDGYRDNELSMEELRAFFKGDNRVADRYLEDIDEFSHEATARDGFISLEEWHDYFQGVANKDQTCPSNNVEASVEVRKKLEVFEMYMKVSKEDAEAKLNGDDSAGKTKTRKKRKKKGQRLSEHYTESDSALLEAKVITVLACLCLIVSFVVMRSWWE